MFQSLGSNIFAQGPFPFPVVGGAEWRVRKESSVVSIVNVEIIGLTNDCSNNVLFVTTYYFFSVVMCVTMYLVCYSF